MRLKIICSLVSIISDNLIERIRPFLVTWVLSIQRLIDRMIWQVMRGLISVQMLPWYQFHPPPPPPFSIFSSCMHSVSPNPSLFRLLVTQLIPQFQQQIIASIYPPVPPLVYSIQINVFNTQVCQQQ